MRIFLPLVALSLFLFGCATGGYQITGKARPAISPGDVKIYSEMPPNAEIIGTVSANNADGYTEHWHPELKELERQAASIGANGIVITSHSWHYFEGDKVSGTAVFVP